MTPCAGPGTKAGTQLVGGGRIPPRGTQAPAPDAYQLPRDPARVARVRAALAALQGWPIAATA